MPARKRQMRRTDVTTWKAYLRNQMKGTMKIKTQTTLTKRLSALALAAILSVSACAELAAQTWWGSPVGITLGQTARVTVANTGTRAIIINGSFLDSEGTVLGQFESQVIEPGKMMSFDLNADDIVLENNRTQIRVVISSNTSKGLLTSTEVFNNDTGETTVFVIAII
jgi:hypothetical protein